MKEVRLPKIKKVISKSNPKLLVAIGIAGFATTAILTGKATIKANELILQKKEELNTEKLELVLPQMKKLVAVPIYLMWKNLELLGLILWMEVKWAN